MRAGSSVSTSKKEGGMKELKDKGREKGKEREGEEREQDGEGRGKWRGRDYPGGKAG